MQSWKQWTLFGLLMLLALALRWTGIDWDGYHHYHPDERYISWVASTIEWPDDVRTALDPRLSPLNPFYWYPDAASEGILVPQDQARDFAYGHVPLYLGVAATRIIERLPTAARTILPQHWLLASDILNTRAAIEFRHLTAVSRALTALVDAGTVLIIFLLGRRLFGPLVGLLAAALLALNVMHIQIAHFFTVDPYLAFFGVTALYFMVRAVYAARPWDEPLPSVRRRCTATCNLLVAAVFAGLAVGAKFSAAMLLLPLAVAAWFALPRAQLWRLAAILAVTLITFLLTNPFAVLDFGCQALTPAVEVGPLRIPALDWRSCYLANIFKQGAMVRGQSDLGFARQYEGTLPYLYVMEMQLRWGMGWPLGLLAFGAFAWVSWLSVRLLWRRRFNVGGAKREPLPPLDASLLVILVWAVPFFLVTGGFYVKFMRYLLPLTPLLMLFTAALLMLVESRRLRMGLLLIVLVPTAIYALSFLNIYGSEHPWIEASRWVYDTLPRGSLIASEQWDDTLPTSMVHDGRLRRRTEYRQAELTWLTGPDELDNEAKLQRNLDLLERADYVILASNRVYGVVPRLEERYPLSSAYHQALFDGLLGYELRYVNTRMPGFWGFHYQPDSFVWPGLTPPAGVEVYLDGFPGISGGRFDESFTVYDQPLVMIFANVERLNAGEMRQYFPQR